MRCGFALTPGPQVPAGPPPVAPSAAPPSPPPAAGPTPAWQAPAAAPGWQPAPPAYAPPPAYSAPAYGTPPAYPAAAYGAAPGTASPMAMNIVGFVFVILGLVASVIAFFLSEEGSYGWSAGIYVLSAFFWLIALVFFVMGRRRVPVMPPPGMYPPR